MSEESFGSDDERFRSLAGSVILQSLPQETLSMPVIPHISLPAHLNGGELFIRNKSHPQQYWTLHDDKVRVDAKDCSATRFQIELYDTEMETLGTPLLIDSDEVL
ncbi:hypothetical protein BDW59DRAFT_164945 [Aspergillus cavernicola]|uniref:Uncharacterized protein n=1 Tax=Aspergillus cavernicola TaxID=176166 RepID=A0ABR4HVU2_9EURO